VTGVQTCALPIWLFITAHDAMHGSVCPGNPWLNDLIGSLSVRCYALLSYRQLRVKHHLHHQAPATEQDPDFHRGSFWGWYFHFMKGYMRGKQGLVVAPGMMTLFLLLLLHFPLANVLIFWGLPLLLSPLQLFYFGTYLPHRITATGYPDEHRARSSGYPVLLSFLTCYHFGYHWEHHEYPHLPWYHLPTAQPQVK